MGWWCDRLSFHKAHTAEVANLSLTLLLAYLLPLSMQDWQVEVQVEGLHQRGMRLRWRWTRARRLSCCRSWRWTGTATGLPCAGGGVVWGWVGLWLGGWRGLRVLVSVRVLARVSTTAPASHTPSLTHTNTPTPSPSLLPSHVQPPPTSLTLSSLAATWMPACPSPPRSSLSLPTSHTSHTVPTHTHLPHPSQRPGRLPVPLLPAPGPRPRRP